MNLLWMEFWTAMRDDEVETRRRAGEIRIMISLRYKRREEEEESKAKKETKDFHIFFKRVLRYS